MTSLEEALRAVGLTALQARIYAALSRAGTASAGELARLTGAPRSQVYELIGLLQEADLVDVHLGTPRRYSARPIHEYARAKAIALRKQADELEARAAELEGLLDQTALDVGTPTGPARVLEGRRAVARELTELLAQAQKEIILVSTAGSVPRIARHLGEFRAQNDRDVSVQLVLPEAVATPEVVKDFRRQGVKVTASPIELRTLVAAVDGRELLRIRPIPDDGRVAVGRDIAFRWVDPVFIHDHVATIRALLGKQRPK